MKTWLKNLIIPIVLLSSLLGTSGFLYGQESFTHQVIEDGFFSNEAKITYFDDIDKLGFIFYTKMTMINAYVIHTFFIHPKFRKRGYGKKLLAYTCEFLKRKGISKIYLQPGPFELENGRMVAVPDNEQKERMKRLINMYKKAGFRKSNRLLSFIAKFLYGIMGIHEDSNYLMVQIIKN